MSTLVPSLIRTYVPLAVAFLVSWLASLGIVVDDSAKTALVTGIGAVAAAAYYFLVRLLERKVPWASIFLVSSVQPAVYTPSAPSGPAVAVPAAAVPDPAPAADDFGSVLDQLDALTAGKHEAP